MIPSHPLRPLERKEVVHIPDHAEFAGDIADVFILQREIFAR